MKTGIRVLLKMAAELPAESNERVGKAGFLPLSGAEERFFSAGDFACEGGMNQGGTTKEKTSRP